MKKIVSLTALSVVGCLTAGSLSAYVLLAPRRTWSFDPLVRVDDRGNASITDGDLGRTRTRNAIVANVAWNGAGAGVVVNAVVAGIGGFRQGDGIPMLNFQDPTGVCVNSCLAATFTGFFRQRANGTWEIFDADIVTNRQHPWASLGEACANEFYTEAIHVHEVGHLLGLGHTNVAGATMFPSVAACNNAPATTEADDEAAIRDLY
jgi:hypothetical protein